VMCLGMPAAIIFEQPTPRFAATRHTLGLGHHHGRNHSTVRGPPTWCSQLLQREKNGSCRAPFTSVPGTAHVRRAVHRDLLLRKLGGSNSSVSRWMSGQGQDWWVWYNHARFIATPLVYVDLATNDPIWRSNTYFFDLCLGWQGLCIEASAAHYLRIRQERSCQLVPHCISNVTGVELTFLDDAGWAGGASNLNTNHAVRGKQRKVKCRALQDVLTSFQKTHVDFLSLDIESSEVPALSSLDFTKSQIDIIVSENPKVGEILFGAGYRRVSEAHDNIFVRGGVQLGIERNGGTVTDAIGVPACEELHAFTTSGQ